MLSESCEDAAAFLWNQRNPQQVQQSARFQQQFTPQIGPDGKVTQQQ